MTRIVEIAVPNFWWEVRQEVALFLIGLLKRSLPTEDIVVTPALNDSFGGVGITKTDAAIATACDVAVSRLNDAMVIQNKTDPFAELRKLSAEDRRDAEVVARAVELAMEENKIAFDRPTDQKPK